MYREQENKDKVEMALGSLDNIVRAEPAPYFYTRLRARMERDEKNVWEKIASMLSRPAVAVASLLLILSFNAFFLFQRNDSSRVNGSAPSAMQGTSVTEDYFTLASNSFDYENLEP